jgi:hypothetical protein
MREGAESGQDETAEESRPWCIFSAFQAQASTGLVLGGVNFTRRPGACWRRPGFQPWRRRFSMANPMPTPTSASTSDGVIASPSSQPAQSVPKTGVRNTKACTLVAG